MNHRDDRLAASINATVGSLLEATDAPALEHGISLSHFEGRDLDAGALHAFREALTPNTIAARFYPLPVNSERRLDEYSGRSKLSRLADTYPPPLVGSSVDLLGEATMTAQRLLQLVFTTWSQEYAWFTAKRVPDLRYRSFGDAYGDGQGLLTVDAVFIPQTRENRRSMRQILDEILAIFPGTAIIQDSDGDLALRPTYGPDAPTVPSVILTSRDVVSVSTGKPDPRGIYNRARVTSTGGEFREGEALTPPAYRARFHFNEDVLADEGVTPGIPGDEERQRLDGTVLLFADDVIVAGDEIECEYTATAYKAEGTDPEAVYNASVDTTVTDTLTLTRDGTVQEIVVAGYAGFEATWQVWWDNPNRAVRVKVFTNKTNAYVGFPDLANYFFGTLLTFDAVGARWVERNETYTGEFGYDLTTDQLDTADGANALQVSQATYGERALEIQTTVFALDEQQVQEVAQGLVLHHINPRTIRRVEQSWWNRFPVQLDHMGRLAQLPAGEVGFVQQRGYADDFSNLLAPVVRSSFEVVVTAQAFTTSDVLLFDTGDALRFDDGTLVEAS